MIKISIWIRHSHTTYELPETNSLHLQKDGIPPQKMLIFRVDLLLVSGRVTLSRG